LPLIMVVLMLLATSGSARRLEGDTWIGNGASGDHPIVQFVKHLYLQQLPGGASASCGTSSQNNPPCHHG
ncbi:hypothetical protein BAE44_0012348, partial [Dichanthelium oligosanthes]